MRTSKSRFEALALESGKKQKGAALKKLIIQILSALTLVISSGCQETQLMGTSHLDGIYARYSAQRVHITALTETQFSGEYENGAALVAYVDLLDQFGSRVKSPGTFRFELYEFKPRQSQPKGARITVWPDIKIEDPQKNNKYWQDFLRTYKFQLSMNFVPSEGEKYIFSVTFINPQDTRLNDEYSLVIEE